MSRRRRIIWSVLGALLALLLVTGVVVYISFNQALHKSTSGASSGNAGDLLTPEPLNGEAKGSVNILLAGNSADDGDHDGADLTDSVMVAQINLTSHELNLISLPRDLWVSYQGTWMKLNAVYPAGGMDALAAQVTTITGLSIDQKALVDYTALRDVVDAIGGIDVDIESPDPRGIYDPNAGLKLANGKQHINGATALALARARNDPPSPDHQDEGQPYGLPHGDFDRTQNQRMIISAIVTKVKSSGVLANPATDISLFNAVGNHVQSDLTVHQLRRLIDLANTMAGINSISLQNPDAGLSLFVDYTGPAGEDALIPSAGRGNYTQIQAFIASSLK